MADEAKKNQSSTEPSQSMPPPLPDSQHQQPEENALLEFWKTTWSAWRSGALAAISETFAQKANNVECDVWARTQMGQSNKLLLDFFTVHKPRPQEFFIGSFIRNNIFRFSNRPVMVITSQRLWMMDMKTLNYHGLEVANILQLRSQGVWDGVQVTVRFKDGTEQTYKKVGGVPSDEALAVAMELCKGQEGVSVGSPLNTRLKEAGEMRKAVEKQQSSLNIRLKIASFALFIVLATVAFFTYKQIKYPFDGVPGVCRVCGKPATHFVGQEYEQLFRKANYCELHASETVASEKSDRWWFVFGLVACGTLSEIIVRAIFRARAKETAQQEQSQ